MAKRQLEIAGTEQETNKELEAVLEPYQKTKKKMMKITKLSGEQKLAVIAVMRKHKIENYRDDNAVPPLLVRLKPGKDNLTVDEVGDEIKTEEAEDETPEGDVQ